MSAVMDVLKAQRKRCLAGIMNSAEGAGWWVKLSRDEQLAFRQQVINSLNVFYDLTRDIVTVTDESTPSVRNEQSLELLLAKADHLQRTLDELDRG